MNERRIALEFRKAENGFVLTVFPEQQGMVGKEHVAYSPADLRKSSQSVFSEELERVMEQMVPSK